MLFPGKPIPGPGAAVAARGAGKTICIFDLCGGPRIIEVTDERRGSYVYPEEEYVDNMDIRDARRSCLVW